MIQKAAKNFSDVLNSVRTVVVIMTIICGGVWWQAVETANTRNHLEKLFQEQAETKQTIKELGSILRNHDGRIIRLEEFKDSF